MQRTVNFDDGWIFSRHGISEQQVDCLLQDGDPVTLPHTWYCDGDYYRGEAVYQKVFPSPAQPGERVFLRFDSVDQCCTVFLNGAKIGSHCGGYTAFTVELTEALRPENILTVCVSNEKREDVSPLSGDFTIFGGIYRSVWLTVTQQICFDRLYFGTSGVTMRTELSESERGYIVVQTHVSGVAEDTAVRYHVEAPDGETAAEVYAAPGAMLRIPVERPALWQGKTAPNLYTVRAGLYVSNELKDETITRVGFRRVEVDAERGFFLNGQNMKLHGVAKHQDTARLFSAAGPAQWEEDIRIVEEIGANALRLSHYPHAQQVYDLCDEKGLIVWAEIPLLKLTQNEDLMQNARLQLREMILQYQHHPSICFWGIQNEIALFGEKPYMAEKVRELHRLARALDNTRLTASANLNGVEPDSELNRITDVTAYNLYYGWYYGKMSDHGAFLDEFHAANPDIPLGVSEYGVDCNPEYHSEKPRVNDYSEEYQALYHETVYPMMEHRPYIWGSFVWNLFDFVSAIRNAGGVRSRNIKGLVTHDRALKKDSFYYYKAVWSDRPFVHIAQKRFVRRCAGHIDIKVYSNQPSVMLFADKRYEQNSDTGVFLFRNVPLHEGKNPVWAAAGPCTDSAVFEKTAQPEPAYQYVDTEPGIHVRNWFADEVEEARMFPEDAYSLRDTIQTLLASNPAMEAIRRALPEAEQAMRASMASSTLEQMLRRKFPNWSDEKAKQLNAQLIKLRKPK